ncbi:hypothetical protein, variant 5 [Phytophthora nicotianae CJ01A1]|uniref:Syntaxin 6/10/61 N-terminal domain-containing protein n=4 Tax=Phytophthora nicotianae TaxID=4792 RepID=W2PMG7_PHYN3|nr:hypothetical protein, variant 5 [Phytophthora nicotianae INRA-310]ETL29241.1 hypothetical protein, variant 5 [Phytophthora nicotianae]ETN02067.1 hypothetical protein, variant 5 [Phytophthora nicotianae INRA-310]ETP05372.1 hypothetical protein, variant 5 [Phytophthora nicotianae CJ01A1]ETP33511.1 hypothetical protein, variant 5 [Phytophthora nicotianae P10297]
MMKKEPSMAAASGDPFYVFKDELESKVSAVNQKHAKWRAILDAKDSPAAKELPALTHQIESAVSTAEKSVKFLEETIVMVEANRTKFEHIDAAEIASRKAFVATTRKELQAVSAEISTDAVKTRIRKEERKLMQSAKSSTSFRSNLTGQERNEHFLEEETQRQQVRIVLFNSRLIAFNSRGIVTGYSKLCKSRIRVWRDYTVISRAYMESQWRSRAKSRARTKCWTI